MRSVARSIMGRETDNTFVGRLGILFFVNSVYLAIIMIIIEIK